LVEIKDTYKKLKDLQNGDLVFFRDARDGRSCELWSGSRAMELIRKETEMYLLMIIVFSNFFENILMLF